MLKYAKIYWSSHILHWNIEFGNKFYFFNFLLRNTIPTFDVKIAENTKSGGFRGDNRGWGDKAKFRLGGGTSIPPPPRKNPDIVVDFTKLPLQQNELNIENLAWRFRGGGAVTMTFFWQYRNVYTGMSSLSPATRGWIKHLSISKQ